MPRSPSADSANGHPAGPVTRPEAMITERTHDGFRAESVITQPRRAHRQLSTHSRSTPRLFDLPGTAATSISTVWIKFGRSAERDRSDIGHDFPRGRAVPDPDRTAPRLELVSRVSTRLASSPHPCGGRFGGTTEFRGGVASRPRLGGTPVSDETVTAGCHATDCGAVSAPAPTHRS